MQVQSTSSIRKNGSLALSLAELLARSGVGDNADRYGQKCQLSYELHCGQPWLVRPVYPLEDIMAEAAILESEILSWMHNSAPGYYYSQSVIPSLWTAFRIWDFATSPKCQIVPYEPESLLEIPFHQDDGSYWASFETFGRVSDDRLAAPQYVGDRKFLTRRLRSQNAIIYTAAGPRFMLGGAVSFRRIYIPSASVTQAITA